MDVQVGDVVLDQERDDETRMVVLCPDRGTADDVYIAALESSVAAVNDTYPSDDVVVECVHEEWLDRHVGDRWETWNTESFRETLEAFVSEWGIPLPTYDYPVSRLESIEERSSPAGQSSLDNW